jgi:hypothetical protein
MDADLGSGWTNCELGYLNDGKCPATISSKVARMSDCGAMHRVLNVFKNPSQYFSPVKSKRCALQQGLSMIRDIEGQSASCAGEKMDHQREAELGLIVGVGNQGLAGLAIFSKLLRALMTKGVLRQIEVIAILDAAAESLERNVGSDQTGGRLVQAAALSIRQMMDQFSDAPPSDQKH